jgi:hypothetical protein
MRIKITNERLWEIAQRGEDIDQWLKDNAGYGGYKEWIGLTMLPYRSFEIHDEQVMTLFKLKFS